MKLTVLITLSIFMLLLPVSVSYSKEEQNTNTLELEQVKPNWVDAISQDITTITIELKTINKETPEGEINKIFQSALEKLEQMREGIEKQGIIIEGFSLNLTLPPSITINFKFKE